MIVCPVPSYLIEEGKDLNSHTILHYFLLVWGHEGQVVKRCILYNFHHLPPDYPRLR